MFVCCSCALLCLCFVCLLYALRVLFVRVSRLLCCMLARGLVVCFCWVVRIVAVVVVVDVVVIVVVVVVAVCC